MVEDLRLHHVDAGVDGVGEHLAPGRLLEEALHPVVVVDDGDAELERVGHPGQADGDQRALVVVELDQVGEVEVGERVAGDDEEGVVAQQVLGVLDAAGRAERRLLGGVVQRHAEVFAVAEVVAHQAGQELHGDHGLGEAVPRQQPQDVLHDRLVDDGEQRLGHAHRHRAQPGALATGHHDRLHCRTLPSVRGAGRSPVTPRPPPGRAQQVADLDEVEDPCPPVQRRTPDGEGPAERVGDVPERVLPLPEQQQREAAEQVERRGLAEVVHRQRAVAVPAQQRQGERQQHVAADQRRVSQSGTTSRTVRPISVARMYSRSAAGSSSVPSFEVWPQARAILPSR